MSTGIRSHLRSNVVGYVAVFLALAGTATALPGRNTVNSGDIVNATVRSADLKNGAGVKGKDVAADSLTGADVDEGSLDLDLEIVEDASANNGESPKFATALCPAGKLPVGAGAHLRGGTSGSAPNAASSVVIDELVPFATGAGATAYEIAGGTAGNWAVTAVAICARLSG